MFDLTTYPKKWEIPQLKTIFSTLDTLCQCSIHKILSMHNVTIKHINAQGTTCHKCFQIIIHLLVLSYNLTAFDIFSSLAALSGYL